MKRLFLLGILVATPVHAASLPDIHSCNPNRLSAQAFVKCYSDQMAAFYASIPAEPVVTQEKSADQIAYEMAVWHAKDDAQNAVDSFNRSVDQYNNLYPIPSPYQRYR